MAVSIEFFGLHRDIAKISKITMPITENTLLRHAIDHVKKLYPEMILDENMVLLTVNQELASPDRLLVSNDTVCILPHIGGG